jgi:hypothetical protein
MQAEGNNNTIEMNSKPVTLIHKLRRKIKEERQCNDNCYKTLIAIKRDFESSTFKLNKSIEAMSQENQNLRQKCKEMKARKDDARNAMHCMQQFMQAFHRSNQTSGFEPLNKSLFLINSNWSHYVQKLCSFNFGTGAPQDNTPCISCVTQLDNVESYTCATCNTSICAKCLGFMSMQTMVQESARKKTPCVGCPGCRSPIILDSTDLIIDLTCDEEIEDDEDA